MIYDKIKIYVSEHIAGILKKDAESFEFFKKDGRTPNHNAFLTQLLVNYSDEFQSKQTRMLNDLQKTLSANPKLSEDAVKALCYAIYGQINERVASPENENFDKLVSLKPTKESQPIVDFIEQYHLEGSSLSEYFRNMFASYAALPQDKREGIIFKKQREALLFAIGQKKKVFLSVAHDKKTSMEIAPYALTSSKEELHGYLIGFANGSCLPVRLSRILSVTVLQTDAVFDETQTDIFRKMLTYGPQFFYRYFEKEIVVELTEKGMDKYRKMYIHRPVPKSINGNIFTFDCSYAQIMQYFQRFGCDAYILSPVRLREDLHRFHRAAFYYYNSRKKAERENERPDDE